MTHLKIKLILLVMMICALQSAAQKRGKAPDTLIHPESDRPKPKLVVGIIVDQMRYDYLFRFKDDFSQGGFNRLMREGFLFENANYNYVPTYTAPGHACVYTGTTPSINGIIANDWYDRSLGKTINCVGDSTMQ